MFCSNILITLSWVSENVNNQEQEQQSSWGAEEEEEDEVFQSYLNPEPGIDEVDGPPREDEEPGEDNDGG